MVGQSGDSGAAGDPQGQARAALVHLLYEVALDPARLADFAQAWQVFRAGLPPGALPLADRDLGRHLARAGQVLDRLPTAEHGAAADLDGVARSPAFLSDGIARIAACNGAAESAFHISGGAPLAALPFEAADVVMLSATIRKVARRAEPACILRLRSSLNGAAAILRISPAGIEAPPQALVVSTEPVWPDRFGALLQETFGLTLAEIEIVRGLTLGLPIRDIAGLRGRSVDTVRTQMRSIQSKTETHSQAELLRMVLGLMGLVLTPNDAGPNEAALPQGLILPDGRRIDWIEFGDPAGRPVLHLHGDFGLSRWTPAAERAARLRHVRVVVPIRAGYGRSDPLPPAADPALVTALDLVALVDHLGIGRCAVLALGADLRFALTLARIRPQLMSGIVACALDLPASAAGHEARPDLWPGLLADTARMSPEMLAFIVKAAAALGRQAGKERFLLSLCGGAASDRAALRHPDVRGALLDGTDICLGPGASAHEAFARSRIEAAEDWSRLLQVAKVPVHLLQGEDDPIAPPRAVERLSAFPGVTAEILPGTGRLLVLAQGERVLDHLILLLDR